MKRFIVISAYLVAGIFLAGTASATPKEIRSLRKSVKKINASLRDISEQLRIAEFRLNQTPKQGEKGTKGDKGERGDKGDKGEKGDLGSQGEQGQMGSPGLGLTDVVPAGTKLTGVIGTRGKTDGSATIGLVGQIPAKLGREIGDGNIFVVITPQFRDSCLRDYPNSPTVCLSDEMFAKVISGETEAKCGGDVGNMEPAPGALCIYPSQSYNVDKLNVRQSPAVGETQGIDAYFGVNSSEKNEQIAPHHAFVAHWAYLAY